MNKKITLIVIALALCSIALSQPTWNLKAKYDLVLDVKNINTYAYVNNDKLYFTSDGDNNATESDLSLSPLIRVIGLYAVNNNTVYTTVKTQSGFDNLMSLWKSTDGGSTFTELGDPLPDGYSAFTSTTLSLRFFDEDNGLAWGRVLDADEKAADIMIRTSDGGNNWVLVPEIEGFRNIFFENGTIIVYTAKTILRSTDNGASWSDEVSHPFSSEARFTQEENTIHAIGINSDNRADCRLKSTDGGTTWNSFNVPDEDNNGLRGCTAAGRRDSYIAARGKEIIILGKEAGNRDRMIYSDDEGDSWQIMEFDDDPRGIAFYFPMLSEEKDVFYIFDGFSSSFYFFGHDDSGGTNSIQAAPQNRLSFYPNPAKNSLSFSEPVNGTLNIYDTQGKKVLSQEMVNQQDIEIAGLQNGIYILKLNDQRAKLIKNE